jgi:ABC-type bacteriocin/lantibiotic exporter with double-glycine peptidase domain
MRTKEGEKVKVKENFKEYLSYLKKYKLLIISLLVVVFLHETKQIVDRYVFKMVIDKGPDFIAGKTTLEIISSTFLFIGIIYGAIVLFNLFLNWMKLHLVNRLDANTIYDLK